MPGVGCSLDSLQPCAQTDRQGANPLRPGLIPVFGGMLVRGSLPHLRTFSIAMPSPEGQKVPQVPAFAFGRNWSPECDSCRDVLPCRCHSLGRAQACTPHPARKSQWELRVPEEHKPRPSPFSLVSKSLLCMWPLIWYYSYHQLPILCCQLTPLGAVGSVQSSFLLTGYSCCL